jgi:ferredoxin--NADP+ reductase
MGYKILDKKSLTSVTERIDIAAPLVAGKARAGQFVMLRINDPGERIPLTIASQDAAQGTITVIFQVAGKTTKMLSAMKAGDEIADLIGPLGRPTAFGNAGTVVFVGGGVGIAEILPVIGYARDNGNRITAVLGARSKELLILEDEIRRLVKKNLFIVTDDGSYGEKGLVTAPLKRLLGKETYNLCYAVGPDVMMRAVCETTRPLGIKTIVSLDANMIDATGMCGTCRVTVGGEVKFTCVDGPEFDGHRVDWDEFIQRQKRFNEEEKLSDRMYAEKHRCKRGEHA